LTDIMTTSPQTIILALLAWVALSGCAGDRKNNELYKKGIAAQSRGDNDTAITCMNTILQNEPRDATAHNELGVAYEAKGDLDKAIINYDEAVKLSPKDADFRYNLGSALGRRGDLDQAISNLDEAIRLNPKLASAYGNRGSIFENRGDFQNAISDYNSAIRLAPDFSMNYAARANAYAAEGEFDKAVADNSKAIELGPKNAEAYNSLGWLLATCRDEPVRNGKQAVAAAQRACELTAWKNWSFIDTLAAACAEAGDFDQAINSHFGGNS
jgi:Flp pilus assembly protein TadD